MIHRDGKVRQRFCRQVKSYITKKIVIYFYEININTLLIVIKCPIKNVELLPHGMYFIEYLDVLSNTTLLLTERFSPVKTSPSSW